MPGRYAGHMRLYRTLGRDLGQHIRPPVSCVLKEIPVVAGRHRSAIFAKWNSTLNSGPLTAPAMAKACSSSAACRVSARCPSCTPTAARHAAMSRRLKRPKGSPSLPPPRPCKSRIAGSAEERRVNDASRRMGGPRPRSRVYPRSDYKVAQAGYSRLAVTRTSCAPQHEAD